MKKSLMCCLLVAVGLLAADHLWPSLTQRPSAPPKAAPEQLAFAQALGLPVTITNSIGMQLVLIPVGEFQMGSSEEELARLLLEAEARNEAEWYLDEIAHKALYQRVRISAPFYLGIHEVTQGQYERLMGANPSDFKGRELPVEMVSWDDAASFCERLSALPEEKAAGRYYRLPSEAEWEYACRAGTTTRYGFGDDETQLDEYAWFRDNARGWLRVAATRPVGQKKPNAWSLYDMHGNVWEWCADLIHNPYASASLDDPPSPATRNIRVNRGGSWNNSAADCQSANRTRYLAIHRFSQLGFRVVADLVSQ